MLREETEEAEEDRRFNLRLAFFRYLEPALRRRRPSVADSSHPNDVSGGYQAIEKRDGRQATWALAP